MNSYNENLQNIVLSSLQDQYLDSKNLTAQLNASKFTLYYAEGATITAEEKLAKAEEHLEFKAAINDQAVINTNISNNLTAAADQANQYLGQAVSNIAVCASNVQLANLAITRLAGDVGSIFSIINAADYESDIFKLAQYVRDKMDDTASEAEIASKVAMDASKLTSEVSASTVLDDAKSTGVLMNNLLAITSAGVDATSKNVAADMATVNAASAKEQLALGVFDCINVDCTSAANAYNTINSELNMNLTVTDLTAISFHVKFNLIRSPFPLDVKKEHENKWYPVKDYYIMVVKENKKLTFSIADAENLLLYGEDQYVKLSHEFEKKSIDHKVDFGSLKLKDSDGVAVTLGVNYVVFVLAVYDDEYKRRINNFDDFLTSPSLPFRLTNVLAAVKSKDIHIEINTKPTDEEVTTEQKFQIELARILKDNIQLASATGTGETEPPADKYKLTFTVKQHPPFSDIHYRVMLLPIGQIKVDPKLAALNIKVDAAEADLKKALNDDNVVTVKALNEELKTLWEAMGKAIKEKKREIRHHIKSSYGPEFTFDLMLAEQVPSGSFMPAVPLLQKTTEPDAKQADDDSKTDKTTHWRTYIGYDTTDNFGNLLVDGGAYIPFVLSLSEAPSEAEQAKFTANHSAIDDVTNIFIYKK